MHGESSLEVCVVAVWRVTDVVTNPRKLNTLPDNRKFQIASFHGVIVLTGLNNVTQNHVGPGSLFHIVKKDSRQWVMVLLFLSEMATVHDFEYVGLL